MSEAQRDVVAELKALRSLAATCACSDCSCC